jgi:molybdopterin molybdotransferase
MEYHAFRHLISVETARHRLLAAARPMARTELVRVENAFGRVAAEAVRAPRPVPGFPRASWDGYALRSSDTGGASRAHPARMRIVGEVFAEQAFPRPVRPGECVAIATGGALPRGTDTIVIFEEAERDGTAVLVPRPVPAGERFSQPGHDFPKGRRLVRAGEVLSAVALGTLASCGIARVRVFARPIVALLPNGNELLSPGARERPGRIYESNNATLAAVVSAVGAIARPRAPLPDDPDRIRRALASALREADLVLATGGSSVGERDHLPRILPELGRLLFHGVAVRAGKPTLAAAAGDRLVVGLPGHPTSCLVDMYWLVMPALRKIARLPGPGWTDGWAVLGGPAVAPTPGLATVVPLRFENGRAFSTYRGSSAITSLAGATAYAMLPPGRRSIRAGSRIPVHFLDPPLGTPRPSADGAGND